MIIEKEGVRHCGRPLCFYNFFRVAAGAPAGR
jgi:hypothetical protein